MHIDDDTVSWLGISSPLETARQHTLPLENEVAELNLQLQTAQQNIYKLVNMQAQTLRDRDEALVRLREKAREAVRLRQKVRDLELAVRSKDRTSDNICRQIPIRRPWKATLTATEDISMCGGLSQYLGIHEFIAALRMQGAGHASRPC